MFFLAFEQKIAYCAVIVLYGQFAVNLTTWLQNFYIILYFILCIVKRILYQIHRKLYITAPYTRRTYVKKWTKKLCFMRERCCFGNFEPRCHIVSLASIKMLFDGLIRRYLPGSLVIYRQFSRVLLLVIYRSWTYRSEIIDKLHNWLGKVLPQAVMNSLMILTLKEISLII